MELRQIFEVLLRRKWVVINIFASIFLTILILTLLIAPWYDSTAKVLIRRSSSSSSMLSSLGLTGGTQGSFSETDRSDYLALATVRPIVDKVVTDLRITRKRTRASLMGLVPFLKPVLSAVGVDVNSTEQPMTSEDLLHRSMLSYLFPRPYVSVSQYSETDIIEIEAISPEPEQAMEIANALAREFIEDELKRVRDDYKGAKKFIDSNLGKSEGEYKKALENLKRFKEHEKTVNLDTETTNVIQQVSDMKKVMLDNQLAIYKSKAALENIEAKLTQIPKYQKASESLKENEMMLNLKMSLRDLYLSLADTKTKYTSDHPVVKDIENKIAQTKDMMIKEMEKVYAGEVTSIDPVYQDLVQKSVNYYADISAYESQNKSLPKHIKSAETEMMSLPSKTAEYTQLQLAVNVTQDVYDSLLKYQYQLGMAESMALSNIYVIEPAVAPLKTDARHRHPDLLMNLILAVLFGAPLGVAAALVTEYLDDTVRSSNDIKSHNGLIFLGNIFKLKSKEAKLINDIDPRSPVRESFRTIRNSIRFASPDKPLKSIVVTSSMQEEGKSFLSANLAISVASEGKKVLLIDGDMRRPNIHTYFKMANEVGLSNYLIGEIDIGAVQFNSGIEGLNIIPTGPIPPDPAKLVDSKRMGQLVDEMKQEYDFIIIDTPPLLPASDALIFGKCADGVVLLVESGRASKKNVSEIVDLLKHADLNIIGAVLNKVSETGSAYYYYQRYK